MTSYKNNELLVAMFTAGIGEKAKATIFVSTNVDAKTAQRTRFSPKTTKQTPHTSYNPHDDKPSSKTLGAIFFQNIIIGEWTVKTESPQDTMRCCHR